MPKYSVIVTRDTTESCVIEVDADHPDHAQNLALVKAKDPTQELDWEVDDTTNLSRHPYVTSCTEEIEED